MSTPDGPRAAGPGVSEANAAGLRSNPGGPGEPEIKELQLAATQVPRADSVPPTHAPTPGVSPAVIHAPIPSGPDFDPQSMSLAIARMANAFFAPPTPGLPTMNDVGQPGLPTGGGAAPVPPPAPVTAPVAPVPPLDSARGTAVPPAAAPDTSVSPFSMPLSFGDFTTGLQPVLSFPLFDHADLPAQPAQAEAPKQPPLPSYELQPNTGLALRPMAGTPFDANAIRREFPILQKEVNGKRLVWLDNAATTQKPQTVIDRLKFFYENENSNIHRAAHTLAARATDAYEGARESVRRFINAPSKNDIVFVRGTTEGINLIAQSWGRKNIGAGDEIVLTHLEHHANIVPWQLLAQEKGAVIKVAPVDDSGQILLNEFEKLLGAKTKLVAFPQVSNALGTVTPAAEMIRLAHRHGAKVMLDGAQGISHMPVDVQTLDPDFYVFSGHKVFGPTGIGAVYGKAALLEAMPPWQGGGNMIQDVTFEKTVYHPPPFRFEAGTGNIADAIGLGAALDWLAKIGVQNVGAYEHELLEYATAKLATVPGLHMIGTAAEKAGVLSFILDGQKTEEVGGLLDREGIAVRSGHHCAQPILRRFGVEASVRASLAPYNTIEDIDALCAALHRLQAGRATLK